MSTPENTRDALSDITNVADDASRRREERREQQRIRRAEMSSEQREEINRKKREYMRDYRARKKATSQNSSNSCASAATLPATSATGINYSEMDQIMPIILDKENIPPHALEDHSHVAIGNATTDSCSEMDQNTPNTLDKENIPSDAHEYQSHVGTSTATTTSGALSVPNDIANMKKNERSAQQRKRRAELTDEQIEANKRRQREYQRQYRARKKAELQNISTTGASFGTGLSTILENGDTEDPIDWLHRNDNYVPRPRGPRTSGPLPTSGESSEHNIFMDLRFAEITRFGRDQRCCGKIDKILLPYYKDGTYILFILDMQNKIVHIMDPLEDETCLEGYNQKMAYIPTLHTIARRLGLAMGLTNAKWTGNIYKWKREYPLVTKVTDNNKYWKLGGFLVYNFMKLWDGTKLPQINSHSTSLRMEFLADILASKANECFDNIPEDVQYMIKELDKM